MVGFVLKHCPWRRSLCRCVAIRLLQICTLSIILWGGAYPTSGAGEWVPNSLGGGERALLCRRSQS